MATGLTLAFDLAALKRLSAPAVAFEDARRWSENLGVVTDQPPYVLTKFTREHGLRNDFPPEPAPAVETLDHMRTHHDTERYVYVVADEGGASAEGWEVLPISEAAERAGWAMAPDPRSRLDSDPSVPDEDDSDWP
ncbi:DUF7124 domain-containing protein [Haloglomus litoreum]|uniref:DUF7124 domain-containing protein n=1 Tax=Haloglomus litoreum TaxID=3034026 RepID=UPI0023E8DFFB|nr:hypothetical protein [Haloglomus sp. DT116]